MFLIAAIVVALAAAAVILLARGAGFRAEFEREVQRGLARRIDPSVITENDLGALPRALQRYLRLSGAVGQPRVHNFHVRFRGQIRRGPTARWMSFTAEQYNFCDTPSRLFIMDASMYAVPFQALHLYIGPSATMRVKIASVLTIVDARGAEMDQGETVTLFNDMCIFAPAALIGAPVEWTEVDARTVNATYKNACHAIHAVLTFNDAGELVDFVSNDRFASSPDGKEFTQMPWSTPVRDYRTYGSYRLASRGEARWHAPAGEYAYIRLGVESVEYNVSTRRSRGSRP